MKLIILIVILCLVIYKPSSQTFSINNNEKEYSSTTAFSLSINLPVTSIAIVDKNYIGFNDNKGRLGLGISLSMEKVISPKYILLFNASYNKFFSRDFVNYKINEYYLSFNLNLKVLLSTKVIKPFLQIGLGHYYLHAHVTPKISVPANFVSNHSLNIFGIPLGFGIQINHSKSINSQIQLRINNLLPDLKYKNYYEASIGLIYKL